MNSTETNTILTNGMIISIAAFAIVALGSGLIGCIVWIFKRTMGEIKAYRAESLSQRAEFNNALNNKFKALNYYMKQTDKVQMAQEEKLGIFHEHARDVKMKLIEHDEKLTDHSKQLMEHEIEIKNLKKTG